MVQGVEVLGKNLITGVTGLYTKPRDGAQEGGALGAAKGILCARGCCSTDVLTVIIGVVKGVVGLAVSPVLAGLGTVTKVAQSIDATTHIFDRTRGEKNKNTTSTPMRCNVATGRRRRPARPLHHTNLLMPLIDTIVLRSFQVQQGSLV
jgi:hypothetical protein